MTHIRTMLMAFCCMYLFSACSSQDTENQNISRETLETQLIEEFFAKENTSFHATANMSRSMSVGWTSCEDSDGGDNAYEEGSVKASFKFGRRERTYTFSDRSYSRGKRTGIIEYSCLNNRPETHFHQCENVDGACKKTESPALSVKLSKNTPDSTIITAESSDVPVGVYEFQAKNEDIEVADISVRITEIDTIESLGEDQPDDINAIDSVSLFYHEDGTAVRKMTGLAAIVSTIDNNGNAFFQDLDLIIEDNKNTLLEVRADFKDMDDQDTSATARSGHAFATAILLDTEGGLAEIRGNDSGNELTDDDITTDNDPAGTVGDITNPSDTMYVFNNKVTAELSFGQPTELMNKSDAELLKFTLKSVGDNTDTPYLEKVIARIDVSNITVGDIYLYNDNNDRIAEGVPIQQYSEEYVFQLNTPDEIDGGQETYIIKGDLSSVNENSSLAIVIDINASAPGSDGIVWKDGGSNGTDGLSVQWINLGEADTSTTRIENRLEN